MNREEQPIVCDLTVFSADTRAELAATVPATFAAVQKVQELADGYAFQFPDEEGIFMALANFVEHERQCCPFFHFVLEAEPGRGPFWLRMTGGAEVKEYMQTVWNDLPGVVAHELIQTGDEDDLDEMIAQAGPNLAEVTRSDR
jgi:hypothetical protein